MPNRVIVTDLLSALPIVCTCVLVGAGISPPCAGAETYPNRPIRLIVPFAPAGGTDIAARAVAVRLTEALGQQVIVDNRPGAGTVIGTDIAAKSAPDGYTLLQGSTSLAINASLRAKLPYDVLRDFAPVTQVLAEPYVLVMQPSSPVHSVRELVALAKAKPGQLNFGSPGTGTGGHLAGELFRLLSATEMVHVPYKGNGLALADVIGGQIDFLFLTILPALPHVKSGKLQALAVSSARRTALLPEVPAVAEAGVPGYESASWTGILAPARTPGPIVERLNRNIVSSMRTPASREWLASTGAEFVGNSAVEFRAYIAAETAKWARVVKAAKIAAD
jgi:tripartite-type tricarboxylate transporter receptor subunit TctC